jgi:DNA-directed RNA polymerase subunit RPC12/RpoP
MASFERTGACAACGREYMVSGTALNPCNETQAPARLRCACGDELIVLLPGSVNRERLVLTPKLLIQEE